MSNARPSSSPPPSLSHDGNLALDEAHALEADPPVDTGPKALARARKASGTRPAVDGPSPRDRRFRAHRIKVDQVGLGEVTARAVHPTVGRFEAAVEDLSFHGMALVLPIEGAEVPLFLAGDRLERLRVDLHPHTLYTGAATVRRVSEREGALVLGIELEERGIALGDVYRMGSLSSFVERFDVARTRTDGISVEFRAWVADLENFLSATKAFLDAEEASLAGLDRLGREQTLADYMDAVAPMVTERMNAAGVELGELVGSLDEHEHQAHRLYYRSRILPYVREAPFLRRAYEKPLGYAGDYEMMNMLYRDHAEGDSLFGRVLNRWAAQEPAAQANINRLEYLGTKIRVELQRPRQGRLRIASIGCGPAREIARLLEQSPEVGPRLEVALIDQESKAIEFGQRTLAPLAAKTGARVQFIDGSIRRLLTARQLSRTLGARDFIYSAGLFDYLNARSFAALQSALYEALVEGGRLLIGNVAAHNTSRWFMEYCLDWFLIHRSPEELLDLAGTLPGPPASVEIESEPLGVNLFLSITK